MAVHQVAARCNRRRLRRSHALENVCWPQPLRGVVKRPRTEHLPGVVPSSLLGKALQYMNGQWPKLVRYVENGNWPISNN
ncbi:IS66 family transposase, partial [Burkholderia glumae]|uniref:IS66 family transposase n=1 Tax=Burkholderia glumae TaxID=337 RepID=UPI003F695DF8